MSFLKRHWFLVGLIVLIPAGLIFGMTLSGEAIQHLDQWIGSRTTSWLVAAILFLMSFSLDSRRLGGALRRPAAVIFGCVLSYGIVPLLAWPLTRLQTTGDFALGLAIAASVPCTMAAASVWTRKAKGNDAVTLLVTLLTNGFCFLLTPLWLSVIAESDATFDAADMTLRLVLSGLIPTALGQLARIPGFAREFTNRHKVAIGVVAQGCILVIVLAAAFKAGPQLNRDDGVSPTLSAVAIVWTSCIVVHVAALALGWYGSRLAGFSRADGAAIAFSGSQKTLPVGLLVANQFGGFTLFPMLMYHASQLFIDTAVADRIAVHAEESEGR